MVVVVHNVEEFIIDKINNFNSLDYPPDLTEMIIFSDGSTDGTEEKIKQFQNNRIHLLSDRDHEGKYQGLNKALEYCVGEIIFFTDADAILKPNALTLIVNHFSNPKVGGVCGQRLIMETNAYFQDSQSKYVKADSYLKKLESRIGSVTSNDGKLYAIRKELFKPIPPAVTDDLFVCLSVVKQKRLFLYEPRAKAKVRLPSRNPAHELMRRRRVVATSLTGIFLMKELLNPKGYGIFSVCLFVNKIIRRFLPIFMVVVFFSSLILSFDSLLFAIILSIQIAFYIYAFLYWTCLRNLSGRPLAQRWGSYAFYFCIGNCGTLIGLIDFILGRQVIKWEPYKIDRK